MSDTTVLGRAAAQSGLTREELLKRAAVGGAVIVAGGSIVKSAQGAPAGLAPRPRSAAARSASV